MTAALREVKTFKLMAVEHLPDTALQLSLREDELYVRKLYDIYLSMTNFFYLFLTVG